MTFLKMHRYFFVGFLLLFTACGARPQVHEFSGQTMGATYNVIVIDPNGAFDKDALQEAVEATLKEVNARFSNWDPTSEVSRFNRQRTTAPVSVSADFQKVMAAADEVYAASAGQFDVTLAPVVELWGFGAPGRTTQPPDAEAIAAAMENVGQARVLARGEDGATLRKTNPSASVYLAAIAKGYGIDAVAETLASLGARDFMVEIGGDLKAVGVNAHGEDWRIGVERPDAADRTIEEIVRVSGLGMATSGDYRNYFEEDGVRYSHIIDAETGRPVTHTTASVTVLAETAMLADAWATALLALGAERGLPIAEEEAIAALFLARRPGSAYMQFDSIPSSHFERLQDAHPD